ncbi:MAG: thymidine kinase [Bifidobacteriaceae bacterium]|jgi:thymidine kinase|nr:thymidine kinase [Bifidobacteriaceae bacterium]
MAKFFFRYGSMNSGKSTMLIQVAHNYSETGQRAIIIKPAIDTKDQGIHSRIGISKPVDIYVSANDDIYKKIKDFYSNEPFDAIVVDEVQFLEPKQVEDLYKITVEMSVPVMAYGLRTDFRGQSFPGAARALDLANVIEEIRTKCTLCSKKANHNSRRRDGKFEKSGEQVVIDDGTEVEYVPLCSDHFLEKVGF